MTTIPRASCSCMLAVNALLLSITSSEVRIRMYTCKQMHCSLGLYDQGPLYKSALHVFSSTHLLKPTNIDLTTHLSPRPCSPHSAASASSTRLEPRGKDQDETLHVPSTRRRRSMTNLGVVKILDVFTCRRSMVDFAFSVRQLVPNQNEAFSLDSIAGSMCRRCASKTADCADST